MIKRMNLLPNKVTITLVMFSKVSDFFFFPFSFARLSDLYGQNSCSQAFKQPPSTDFRVITDCFSHQQSFARSRPANGSGSRTAAATAGPADMTPCGRCHWKRENCHHLELQLSNGGVQTRGPVRNYEGVTDAVSQTLRGETKKGGRRDQDKG